MRNLVILLTEALIAVAVLARAIGQPDKIYSYMCLNANQELCLGISTSVAPVYDPNNLFNLQVKARDNVELKGEDWMRTRWSVYRTQGIIQLANFTSLCMSRQDNTGTTPGNVVLKPCMTNATTQTWNLQGFLSNVNEQSTISPKDRPDQCLTLMSCQRTNSVSGANCIPNPTTEYTGNNYETNGLRGAYLKMMPCKTNDANQQFRQTIDCAPGCSPFMMQGPHNKCDLPCANALCNWDNGACGTPSPTPPTNAPSGTPTTSPTTSQPTSTPSATPTFSPTKHPSKAPTTSRPSNAPVTSHPTMTPSFVPSRSPSVAPTTSSPSFSPSSVPTSSTPTRSPSGAPSRTPSKNPSSTPTESPTRNSTSASNVVPSTGDPLLWLWILLGVLLGLLLCCCFAAGAYKRRRKNEDAKSDKSADKAYQLHEDVESPTKPHHPSSDNEPNLVFVSTPKPSSQPKSTSVRSPPGVPIVPVVFPLHTPVRGDHFELGDRPENESLTFSDDSRLTPRSAAAQASLNPDPSKRPKGGAPGLVWGGSQADKSESENQEKSMLRQQSERLQEGELPGVISERSFRMPRENVQEGVGEGAKENPKNES